MAGPSVEEIQAALDVYKQSIANEAEKRADKLSKRNILAQVTETANAAIASATGELDVSTTAHVASIEAMIAAEAEMQRLNDEHTPNVPQE